MMPPSLASLSNGNGQGAGDRDGGISTQHSTLEDAVGAVAEATEGTVEWSGRRA